MADVKNENEVKDENKNETEGKQQQTEQQQAPAVDTEKIKSDAVAEYLKGIGCDDETLKGIVSKHKEEEEKNSTDLEKVQKQLATAVKELSEERSARTLAEAKLAALKLGAKADLVDDLVVVAMSRTTKDKDVSAVIAEIKSGASGSVYFENKEQQEEENKGKNLTGGTKKQDDKKDDDKKDDDKKDDFMERMKQQREKSSKKSSFWKR